MSTTLSVVIPAYNEAACIGRTVASVFAHVPDDVLADVVVVDHGSTDDTAALAGAAGARVAVYHDGTIAAQRNRGATMGSGDVLLFLDADTTLTAEWGDALPAVLEAFDGDPLLVTGSHVRPPEDGNWLERHWFAPLANAAGSRHLGSAHLLISRQQFDAIGGFDEALETGEDFDICIRASAAGSDVVNNERLVAVHHDFPKTLARFVRREAWHGIGNFQSFAMVKASPVALATVAFVGLHAAIPVVALVSPRRVFWPIAGIASLCAASSVYKFRHAPPRSIAVNTGVFYFYYLGRSLALLRALSQR